MDSPIQNPQSASFAVKRRPISVSYRKPIQQSSSPSPLTSSLTSSQSLGVTRPRELDNNASVQIDVSPSSDSGTAPPEKPVTADTFNHGIPTPPPSASPSLSHGSPLMVFPPPGTDTFNLTPSPPAQASVQPYFPPPPSVVSSPPAQTATIPVYDPSKATYSHPAFFVPGQTNVPTFQVPNLPSPVSGPSGPVGIQASAETPVHIRAQTYGSAGMGVNPGYSQSVAANTKRLSTWSKEAADKYWNKATAKKAYKNSKEFLVKTNDKIVKVLDPLMPAIAVTNPNFAAAYQAGQALNANAATANTTLAGLSAAQAGTQPGSSLNNFAPLLGAFAQMAVNNTDGAGTAANPLLQNMNQPGAATSFTVGTDPSSLVPGLQYDASAASNNVLAAILQSGGADTNPLLEALNQSGNSSTGIGADPNALMAALTQNSGQNAALIQSYIQQQANASTASFINMMGNAPGNSAQNPFVDILAAGVASQNSSVDLMNSLMQQQQAADAAALANLAAFDPQPVVNTPQAPSSYGEGLGAGGVSTTTTQAVSPETSLGGNGQGQDASSTPQSSGVSATPTAQAQTACYPGTAQAPRWAPHRVAMFGLESILLPPNANLRFVSKNTVIGDLALPSAHFEIRLLYNSTQVLSEMASMQALTSDEDMAILEHCSMTDFGIPCGGVSITCAVCARAAAEDGIISSVYKAVVQSPHGHGIAVSYFVPAQYLNTAKVSSHASISSIKWLDRTKICKSVPGAVLGKWKYEDDTLLLNFDAEPTSGTKELSFSSDGRYTYDRNRGTKDYVLTSEINARDHTSGRFEVYQYENGEIHLVMTDDLTGGIEVQDIQITGLAMTVKGKTYRRIGSTVDKTDSLLD